MKQWSLQHGKDGYSLRVWEVPAWTRAIEVVSEQVCSLTRHRICCRVPEVLWNVPTGRPKRDKEGELDNSVGAFMWDHFTRLFVFSYKYEKNTHTEPVDIEVARRLAPEFVKDCEDIFSEPL